MFILIIGIAVLISGCCASTSPGTVTTTPTGTPTPLAGTTTVTAGTPTQGSATGIERHYNINAQYSWEIIAHYPDGSYQVLWKGSKGT